MAYSPYNTVLVTGGAGFIGSNFVHYWTTSYPDTKLINLDALTYAGNRESVRALENNLNYVFVEGSILDRELVDKVMTDVDAVIHFAAESHVDRSIIDPTVFLNTNIIGTQVLLEAALKHNVKRFHHISTDEVFGSLPLDSNTQFNEHTSYDPRSPYSASKAGSDHLVRAYGETFGLPFTLTNCSNNYGEYQFPEKLMGLVITNLIEGKSVPVYGDGKNVRDWLYVQDHCRAIDLVLNRGVEGETYLIGGLKQDINNITVVKTILDIMGESEDKIEFVTDRPGHDRRYSVDWNKINRELGWEPSVTFEEGLRKTIAWYQNHREWWQPLKERETAFFTKNYEERE
jgi:dTDP-glucose 4,6-dehydratase